MSTYNLRQRMASAGFLIMLFILAGCARSEAPSESPAVPSDTQSTITPISPSATTPPMAVTVNGEDILLADYQSEINRLQQALTESGQTMTADEQKETVLAMLIDSSLLAQEAVRSGSVLDEAEVQSRLDDLAVKLGGSAALIDWMNKYGYDDASLQRSLKLQMLAAQGRDIITSTVGDNYVQVHARQIRTSDETAANSYFSRLQAGTDFATLAEEVDPLTGGELGWFPDGYLLYEDLNEAVLTLKPGEYSQVIKTQIGYHIIQVIERDETHPLTSETRLFLQHRTLETWLQAQRDSAEIEVLVP